MQELLCYKEMKTIFMSQMQKPVNSAQKSCRTFFTFSSKGMMIDLNTFFRLIGKFRSNFLLLIAKRISRKYEYSTKNK